MKEFKWYFNQDPMADQIEIYLFEYAEKTYYHTISEGKLVRHPKEEAERGTPILSMPLFLSATNLLHAMADGLKDAGIVAEVDNAQRITSEAVAKERKDEITWLRAQIEKQLENK